MSDPGHVVVVGAGLGGLRTAERLRAAGHDGPITLVGAEAHLPYDRPPLSKQILTGAWEPPRTLLASEERLREQGVAWRLGAAADGLNGTTVTLADGSAVHGDAVVLATGLRARGLAGQPAGVHTLRDLDDAIGLRDALRDARSLLVLGAGFVGAEVASAARGLGPGGAGLDVTVLEALPLPLTRVFGDTGGALCARLLTEAGIDLRCNTLVKGFQDSRTVSLADGSSMSADVVLVALGGTPHLPWIADSADGLRCDASGRVLGASRVWAVGDVAAWECGRCGGHHRTEHWTSAVDQATAVARDMLGLPSPTAGLPYFWSDQFGLKIQLIGRPGAGERAEVLHGSGPAGGPVKGTVLGYFADGRLVTVAAFGAPRLLARYRPLVEAGASHADALALAAELDGG